MRLDIPCPSPLHFNVVSVVLRDLIKYILYMRQQIPSTFDDLQRITTKEDLLFQNQQQLDTDAPPRRRVLSSKERRIRKFLSSSELVFSSLEDRLRTGDVSYILLVFGSSTLSPREVFIVRFPEFSPDVIGVVGTTDERARDISRRVIRSIVLADLEVFRRDLPPTKLSVLVRSSCSECPQHFCPKQAFVINTRHVAPIEIRIGDFSASSSKRPLAGIGHDASTPRASKRRPAVLACAGLDFHVPDWGLIGRVRVSDEADAPQSDPQDSESTGFSVRTCEDDTDIINDGSTWFQLLYSIQGVPPDRGKQ
mmetsp:Transcript_24188/g.39738  ORF Transcript_24188/g.39738 Transcript_24188/m.39738 type:complete len:309 (-) Transcript_24188:457-1383(-)